MASSFSAPQDDHLNLTLVGWAWTDVAWGLYGNCLTKFGLRRIDALNTLYLQGTGMASIAPQNAPQEALPSEFVSPNESLPCPMHQVQIYSDSQGSKSQG
jgi:hypothetical protein